MIGFTGCKIEWKEIVKVEEAELNADDCSLPCTVGLVSNNLLNSWSHHLNPIICTIVVSSTYR